MTTVRGTGFSIQYPPYEDGERFYTTTKLDCPNGDNHQSHSLNLFFEKRPFKGLCKDILSIEVSALTTIQPYSLESMKLIIRMKHYYEDDEYLLAYLNSLDGKDIGSGFQFNCNFNHVNPEDNKLSQEKAEALFLFLLANIGLQPINLIKNAINFKTCADPKHVKEIAEYKPVIVHKQTPVVPVVTYGSSQHVNTAVNPLMKMAEPKRHTSFFQRLFPGKHEEKSTIPQHDAQRDHHPGIRI